jgi:hypothetical protein
MRKLALIILAFSVILGCNSKPAPTPAASQTPSAGAPAPITAPPSTPAASSADVQPKLQELAGKGATDCGDVKSLSGEELKAASDCAMQAAKAKKPFLVSYDMPGLSVGVAGNAEGKLFTVQSSEQAGKPMPPSSMPCPSELRIANSGRVTCMPAGSMGAAPGSGNPHAGGMGAAAPGTPNPHATAPSKSH